jgi:hypothetical protein
MSVNGLGSVSKESEDGEKNSVPLILERDRIHNMDVQGDQQTSGALIPVEIKRQPYTKCPLNSDTYHKAVAAKHIVLPTYMGSRSTLNGNPSTRWSIKIPK